MAPAALTLSALLGLAPAAAQIPATPVMTLYQFNGPLSLPYYDADRFLRHGASSPAGVLAQGTSVIPCLVIRGGKPLVDGEGTPYVGFEVVVDARDATPASTARFTEIAKQRQEMKVENHHCPAAATHVIEARRLYALGKPPRFDPPPQELEAPPAGRARGALDEIVRAFHASVHCAAANRRLIGRRDSLRRAWVAFIADSRGRWPESELTRAMHLDYVMRTVLYEGHLDRGCNAYGACERNVIALSIRNRARDCLQGQGCRFPGDFEGVASAVSQYNIWDEYLTQVSGLTSCFLRPDIAGQEHYARLQAMYEQSAPDVERILYGGESDLKTLFPGHSPAELTRLRHYYHPPAMGKCFPDRERLEYMSAAVARRGEDFALIANTWIEVGDRQGDGYLFREAHIDAAPGHDIVRTVDSYPGFVVDARKVRLERTSRCAPYGLPGGCRLETIGRYRKTPAWLSQGEPMRLACRVRPRGEDCRGDAAPQTTTVGGACDTEMQPVTGVP